MNQRLLGGCIMYLERDIIIAKVKSKLWQRTHKYVIRVPRNMKEAGNIYAENRNSMWMDAVRMEMKNVMIAFDELESPLDLEKNHLKK